MRKMPRVDTNREIIGRNSSCSGSSINTKRSRNQNASPISPLSLHTPSSGSIDFTMHNLIGYSHHQLYQGIFDMECSDDSQSFQGSFTPYDNESRIDSELNHLVGADNHVVDAKGGVKEVAAEEEQEKAAQSKKKTKKKKKEGRMSRGSRVEAIKANNVESNALKPPTGRRNTSKRSVSGSPLESRNSKNYNASGKRVVEKGIDNPDLGPYLLKKARHIISSGDNSKRALDYVVRAKKSFESCAFDKLNLDYVMCLHMLASIHCSVGKHKEAISLLEHSIEIPSMELGQNHALAKFVGCMQLGDIYATMGQMEKAIHFYKVGLEIQKEVLGEYDPRYGENCRYVAEAYIQIFGFDEAEKLCQRALDIHKINGCLPSTDEASNRRLMGLISESKGNYEAALDHYLIASMAMHCNGQVSDVATVDCNIGDVYLALGRYDEAILSFRKALASFTSTKGKKHITVASVFVRLGELYNKIGKFSDSKSYCESALRIYSKPPSKGTNIEDIADGLTDLATIYESMNEFDQTLSLLRKALKLHGSAAAQKSKIAGIEAQVGVLYFKLGNYTDSYIFLKSSVVKFEASGEKVSSLYATTLNQLGLTCVKLYEISEAAELFDEARTILEQEYGMLHPDTLAVYSNLAVTYDALGKWDDAIELLEFVVLMREEKLGTADPVVDDEKRRLTELLSEAGKVRRRDARSLETLFNKF